MGVNFVVNDFYCISCGQKGIPLGRKTGSQRGAFHRKKLYCPNCKQTVNHVECKTEEDVNEFLNEFKNGAFQKEAEESLVISQGGTL